MQSEIDDIRADLGAMTNLVNQGLLDGDSATTLINRIGHSLRLIELQQCELQMGPNVVRLQVLTLASIVAQARARQTTPRFTVIQGERA